jgi:hypothetical protein
MPPRVRLRRRAGEKLAREVLPILAMLNRTGSGDSTLRFVQREYHHPASVQSREPNVYQVPAGIEPSIAEEAEQPRAV